MIDYRHIMASPQQTVRILTQVYKVYMVLSVGSHVHSLPKELNLLTAFSPAPPPPQKNVQAHAVIYQ